MNRPSASRVRLFFAAVAIAICALATAAAPHAFGGPGLYIKMHNWLNDAPVPAQARMIAARTRSCWYDGHLWPPSGPVTVPAGQTIRIYTEKNDAFGTGCHGDVAARRIDIQTNELAQPGAGATSCQPAPPPCGWRTPLGLPGDYRIFFEPNERASNFGFNFLDNLTTWVPRADGRGLVCWDTDTRTTRRNRHTTAGYADIWILGDARCDRAGRAQPANVRPDPRWYCGGLIEGCPSGWEHAASQRPGSSSILGGHAKAAADEGKDRYVVDLLSTVGVACDWYAYPGNAQYCKQLDVGSHDKSNLRNLTTKVDHFNITGSDINRSERFPVGEVSTSIPPGGLQGQLSVAKTFSRATEATTTVTHGATAGVELAFTQTSKFGLPGVAEGGFETSQTFSAGYNFSNAKAERTEDRSDLNINITAGAAPGYTTTLDVFSTQAAGNYKYEGDIEFGSPGAVEPVTTPATQALNMSPATRHPCLGYVVGDDTVRNSIMNIGKAQKDSGVRDNEATLTEGQRLFLRSIPGFKTASQPCPGFPAGFASQASFKGTGVGTYASKGYDAQGNPVSKVIGCVYTAPFPSPPNPPPPGSPGTPAPTPTSNDSPCQAISAGTGGAAGNVNVQPGALGSGKGSSRKLDTGGAGVLIKARGEDTEGTPVSDKVIGADRDEEISTGSGTFEQVYARGGDDVVSGGPGEDLIDGGNGEDELDGGGGFDALHGEDGHDTLREPGGTGSLNGDGGDDTLIASGSHQLAMLGGAGDDQLFSRDESASSLSGGPGDDRYVVTASGKTEVFEMPGDGDDVLRVNRRTVVPTDIERVVATGGRPVELRSTDGSQALIGNRAANVLAAGPDSDRVHGGRGGDRIVLDEFGFDAVTGGNGADSFVPRGSPANADRPAGLEDPLNRTAHRITGFHPGRGDRIVMLASVFGKELLEHDKTPTIVRGRDPGPNERRATVLFDDRTGLVSFDRDGTGPISDKVAVVLFDKETLKRSWLEIRG